MNAAREISQMTEAECIHALANTAQPGSVMAAGLAARLQQLQLEKLTGATAEVTVQAGKLLTVAEEQRMLASKLDRQTDTLIGLTRWLRHLTVWVVVLSIALCGFEAYHLLATPREAGSNPDHAPVTSTVPSAAPVHPTERPSSAAARASALAEPTRFELVQSPLAAKWTFRLDRFTGRVWQLVQAADKDLAWDEMTVRDAPAVGALEKKVRFQIFTSPLAARHTFLIDLTTGSAWRLTAMLDENDKETETVWQPFSGQ